LQIAANIMTKAAAATAEAGGQPDEQGKDTQPEHGMNAV
jgi:hypothetical protein